MIIEGTNSFDADVFDKDFTPINYKELPNTYIEPKYLGVNLPLTNSLYIRLKSLETNRYQIIFYRVYHFDADKIIWLKSYGEKLIIYNSCHEILELEMNLQCINLGK